jgi:hypothetical protein
MPGSLAAATASVVTELAVARARHCFTAVELIDYPKWEVAASNKVKHSVVAFGFGHTHEVIHALCPGIVNMRFCSFSSLVFFCLSLTLFHQQLKFAA